MALPAEDRERIRRELTELFMQVFAEELTSNGGAPLVTTAGPDVLRLSAVLPDVYVNAPDTLEPGRSRTYVMSAGHATLVAELRDSESGAIIGRLVRKRAELCRGAARDYSRGKAVAPALRRCAQRARDLTYWSTSPVRRSVPRLRCKSARPRRLL